MRAESRSRRLDATFLPSEVTKSFLRTHSARPRVDVKSATNGDYHDQTKHRFRTWPLGRWIMLQQADPDAPSRGHEVMTSQHGLDSLATDVAAVKACLARVHSPAILVGHSYGGTLITHAGTDTRVAGLVYIAALAPDADETSQSLLGTFPTSPVFDHLDVPEGRIWLKQSGVKHFAGDLPEAEQKLIYATQGAPVADLFNQKVEGAAWKSKPSWYVLG